MLQLPWEDRHLVLNGMYDLCIPSREVLKPEAGTVLAALELKHLGWRKLVFAANHTPPKCLVCLIKCFRLPIIGASRNEARFLPGLEMLLRFLWPPYGGQGRLMSSMQSCFSSHLGMVIEFPVKNIRFCVVI